MADQGGVGEQEERFGHERAEGGYSQPHDLAIEEAVCGADGSSLWTPPTLHEVRPSIRSLTWGLDDYVAALAEAATVARRLTIPAASARQ
ncbi:hypothetical protein [Cryobacterium sp. BB307]|uniref:hypothetical protein n=1 Tax=Cryobacterium sp. BB307 TaxID=2716317 RepID=UPI001445F813|nr:hypothetical protein [Cryobacterium sp. BB307]